jgi:hypothetical protein
MALYNDDGYHDSSQDWSPEPDDEEFERRGKYHLTGLADRCVIYEEDCSVYPKRHGCFEVNPFVYGGFKDGHPPFHPYCLETYRRVSTWRLGRADLSDVAEWLDRRDSNTALHRNEPPHHPAVWRGAGQWWDHMAGDEFLVADRLHVPGLSALFEAAKRPQHDFDAQSSPFGDRPRTPAISGDIFDKLPEELRDIVLVDLGSQDVANLRVASRSFRHLPYTLWRDLMKKEMPWIW